MASLHEQLRALLLQADLVGIYDPEAKNEDEYDPEIEIIINRLPSCKTVSEIQDMLREVFASMFSPGIAGSRERYLDLAQKISALR